MTASDVPRRTGRPVTSRRRASAGRPSRPAGTRLRDRGRARPRGDHPRPLLIVRQTFVGVLAVADGGGAPGSWRDALRRGAGIEVPLPVLLVGGQAMIWLAGRSALRGLALAFAATALGCLVWRMRAGAAHYLRDVSAGLFTAVYVPLFCAFAAHADGRAGRRRPGAHVHDLRGRLGRRRLRGGRARRAAPDGARRSARRSRGRASPGSLVAGMIAGRAHRLAAARTGGGGRGRSPGALLVVTATLGDLVESLVKRDLGIKDMGTPAARPRRPHGPARLAAAHGRRLLVVLGLIVPLR